MATPPRSSPRGGYPSQQPRPPSQRPEHGSPKRRETYPQHPNMYMSGPPPPHYYGRGHGGSHGPPPSQEGELPVSSRGSGPGNPPGQAELPPQSQQGNGNGNDGGSFGYGPPKEMYGSGSSGGPPHHMYYHGPPQGQPFQYNMHGGPSSYGGYPPYGYPPHGYGPPPGYHQYPTQQHGPAGSTDDLQYKSPRSGKENPDKGLLVGKDKKSTSSSLPLSTSGRSPAKNSSEASGSPKDEASSPSRPKLEESRDEDDDDEEEDILADKVNPMRSDFHFYAMDHKVDHFESACKAIKQQIGNSAKDEDLNPYLVMSKLNDHLIKAWEQESNSVRTTYMKKEEDDRKRFMTEDEIASRHCATLTARAKSPKAPGSRSSPGQDKKKCDSYSEDEDDGDEEQSSHHKITQDKKQTSLNKVKQEGRQSTSQDDESNRVENDVDDNGKSPTKKLKSVESAELLSSSAAVKQEFLDKFAPTSSENLYDQSKSVINDLDIESNNKNASKALDEKKHTRETSIPGNDNALTNIERKEEKILKKEWKNVNDGPGRLRVIEKLLDRRTVTIRGKRVTEYLVRWKDSGKDGDSWEPLQMVSHLEDQVHAIDEMKDKESDNLSPRTRSHDNQIIVSSPSRSLRSRR